MSSVFSTLFFILVPSKIHQMSANSIPLCWGLTPSEFIQFINHVSVPPSPRHIFSFISPHVLPCVFPSVLVPVFTSCDSFFSHSFFSLLIYLSAFSFSPPPLSPSLPLCLSGRLHIAVSQYHGGRQWCCCSGGECSTGTAGNHSDVQLWHRGQVRLQDVAGTAASWERFGSVWR